MRSGPPGPHFRPPGPHARTGARERQQSCCFKAICFVPWFVPCLLSRQSMMRPQCCPEENSFSYERFNPMTRNTHTAPTPAERLLSPFQEFLHLETSGGIVLLVCTAAALVWANIPSLAPGYVALWQKPIVVGVGSAQGCTMCPLRGANPICCRARLSTRRISSSGCQAAALTRHSA